MAASAINPDAHILRACLIVVLRLAITLVTARRNRTNLLQEDAVGAGRRRDARPPVLNKKGSGSCMPETPNPSLLHALDSICLLIHEHCMLSVLTTDVFADWFAGLDDKAAEDVAAAVDVIEE